MKLLRIKLEKGESTKPKQLVMKLLEQYPDATTDDIFATMLKNGITISLSTIRCYRADFVIRNKIKLAMGVK